MKFDLGPEANGGARLEGGAPGRRRGENKGPEVKRKLDGFKEQKEMNRIQVNFQMSRGTKHYASLGKGSVGSYLEQGVGQVSMEPWAPSSFAQTALTSLVRSFVNSLARRCAGYHERV